MIYTWKLNDNHFTLLDRLKIGSFLLNPLNQWTSGQKVIDFEKSWQERTYYRHAVMTSSGTTAIELLARTWKRLYKPKGVIFFPALTWPTSVTPWIEAGYEPVFVDVDKYTLCMSLDELEKRFSETPKEDIAGIFLTNTLGTNIRLLPFYEICNRLAVDNCESTFSIGHEMMVTTVTSFYFGHQFTTGTEGGMLFTNNEEEFRTSVLLRGHGLDRELNKYTGDFSGKFDFSELGSNFRSNDLAAYMGSLDSHKYEIKKQHGIKLYNLFKQLVNFRYKKFDLFSPFCIPVVSEHVDKRKVESRLNEAGIETRPLISGNILKHKPFMDYGTPELFPNASWLDDNGLYVGLHLKITENDIIKLAEILNELVS